MEERVLRWGWGGESWLIWVFLLMHGSGISGGERVCRCAWILGLREREREGDERDLVCIHDELAK
jgi:hypothetical protein